MLNKRTMIFSSLNLNTKKKHAHTHTRTRTHTHLGTAGHVSMLSKRRIYEIIMQFLYILKFKSAILFQI